MQCRDTQRCVWITLLGESGSEWARLAEGGDCDKDNRKLKLYLEEEARLKGVQTESIKKGLPQLSVGSPTSRSPKHYIGSPNHIAEFPSIIKLKLNPF